MLEFFRQSKFNVHQSARTQNHNKDTEIPLGIADGNRAAMPPIDLSAFSRSKSKGEKGFLPGLSQTTGIFFYERIRPGISDLANELEKLLCTVRMTVQ